MHAWDVQDGAGTGNTALAFHNKQLLALLELDLPYVVSSFVRFSVLKHALCPIDWSIAMTAGR